MLFHFGYFHDSRVRYFILAISTSVVYNIQTGYFQDGRRSRRLFHFGYFHDHYARFSYEICPRWTQSLDHIDTAKNILINVKFFVETLHKTLICQTHFQSCRLYWSVNSILKKIEYTTVVIIEFSQKGTTVLEIDIRQIRYTTVMEINISWYVHHGPENIISQIDRLVYIYIASAL